MLVRPLNRHLMVSNPKKQKDSNQEILLPDDFLKETERYVITEAFAAASDCKPQIQQAFLASNSVKIIVRSEMIEAVTIAGNEQYFVLENHVLGIISDE